MVVCLFVPRKSEFINQENVSSQIHISSKMNVFIVSRLDLPSINGLTQTLTYHIVVLTCSYTICKDY